MVSSKKSRIDPQRQYGLMEIHEAGFFPWAKNQRTVQRIVEADRRGENMLQSEVSGEGRLRRYKVTGKHLIKFLEKYGPGMSIRAGK